MHYNVSLGGKEYKLDLGNADRSTGRWVCKLNGREIEIDVAVIAPDTLSLLIDGKAYEARHERAESSRTIFVRGTKHDVIVRDARSLRNRKRIADADGPLQLRATMPGKVVRVLAKEGESIRAGQGVVVVEAMKMQNEIRSPKDGVVKKLLVREGLNVNSGDVLAVME